MSKIKLTECECGLFTHVYNYCLIHKLFDKWNLLSKTEQTDIIYKIIDILTENGIGIIPILHLETCIDKEYLNMHRELSEKKGKELYKFFEETNIIEELINEKIK